MNWKELPNLTVKETKRMKLKRNSNVEKRKRIRKIKEDFTFGNILSLLRLYIFFTKC